MLDAYAVIGTYDEIADKLKSRYQGLATHIEFAIPVAGETERATLGALIERLRQPSFNNPAPGR